MMSQDTQHLVFLQAQLDKIKQTIANYADVVKNLKEIVPDSSELTTFEGQVNDALSDLEQFKWDESTLQSMRAFVQRGGPFTQFYALLKSFDLLISQLDLATHPVLRWTFLQKQTGQLAALKNEMDQAVKKKEWRNVNEVEMKIKGIQDATTTFVINNNLLLQLIKKAKKTELTHIKNERTQLYREENRHNTLINEYPIIKQQAKEKFKEEISAHSENDDEEKFDTYWNGDQELDEAFDEHNKCHAEQTRLAEALDKAIASTEGALDELSDVVEKQKAWLASKAEYKNKRISINQILLAAYGHAIVNYFSVASNINKLQEKFGSLPCFKVTSSHDQYSIHIDVETFARVLSPDHIVYLINDALQEIHKTKGMFGANKAEQALIDEITPLSKNPALACYHLVLQKRADDVYQLKADFSILTEQSHLNDFTSVIQRVTEKSLIELLNKEKDNHDALTHVASRLLTIARQMVTCILKRNGVETGLFNGEASHVEHDGGLQKKTQIKRQFQHLLSHLNLFATSITKDDKDNKAQQTPTGVSGELNFKRRL